MYYKIGICVALLGSFTKLKIPPQQAAGNALAIAVRYFQSQESERMKFSCDSFYFGFMNLFQSCFCE